MAYETCPKCGYCFRLDDNSAEEMPTDPNVAAVATCRSCSHRWTLPVFEPTPTPVPPRTVFVNPVVIAAVLARRPLVGVDMSTLKSIKFKGGRADSWRIVPDPDCPLDYAWPESAPPEVAAVVRQGIEDARKAKP